MHYCTNIESNLEGSFTVVDSSYQHIWEGIRSVVSLKDINQDGYPDMLIGNYSGGISLYMGNESNAVATVNRNTDSILIFPNPSSNSIQINASPEKIVNIKLHNTLGEIILSQNGNAESLIPINVSDIATGTYWLEITTTKNRLFRKVMINR